MPPEPPEEEYVPHTKPRTAAEMWAEHAEVISDLPANEQLSIKRAFYAALQMLLWDFDLIPNKDDLDAVDAQVGTWYDEVTNVEGDLIIDSIKKSKLGGGNSNTKGN